MTEKKLKGLFGGGEAHDAPEAPMRATADAGAETVKPGRSRRRDGSERRGGGGGGGGRRRQRSAEEVARAQDFVNRYTSGNPTEGFSSDEAIGYLRELKGEVPPEVMQRAAVETVRNLPEDQRRAFAEMLQRRQAGTGMVTIERTGEARAAQGREGGQAGGAGMDDLFGSLFGGMLGGGMAQPAPQPQSAPGGLGADDMLGGLLGGLLGGGMAQSQQQAPSGGGLGDIFGSLFGGGDEPEPEAEPRRRQQQQQRPQEQAGEEAGGLGDILGSPLGKAVLGGIAAFALKEMMDKQGR